MRETSSRQSTDSGPMRAHWSQELQSFLLKAGELLASSLDYQEMLVRIANLAVPHIADWCAVDVLDEDGSLARLAVAHVDPERVAWAHDLQRRYPADPDSETGVNKVVRSGQPRYYPEISDDVLAEAARDEEHLRLLRQVGFSSAVVAPLAAHDRTLGAVTFVLADSGRHYDRSDLTFLEELARRAAVAVDNARLHQELSERQRELERSQSELEARVAARTAALTEANRKLEGLNQDLRRQTDELEAVNRELEAFSYSVSHDLRAPLRGVDGFSQALLEDYGDELDVTAKGYMTRIRSNAQRMGELIDGLLTLSRLTRSEMDRESVDLSRLAEGVVAELRSRQPARRVEVTIEPNIWAEADERLIRLVLENLLENAWKFTARLPQARIAFKATRQGDDTVYVVEDNGAGFDMRYGDKLFGAFQRLHTPDEFPGSGIGLATVQRIIHRHNGRIWAEAEVDQGARFYFTLAEATGPGGAGAEDGVDDQHR